MPATRDAWVAARAAYEGGTSSVSEIARVLGVSHQAVSRRRGIERWLTPATLPDSHRDIGRPSPPRAEPAERVRVEPAPPAPVSNADWPSRAPSEALAAGLSAAAVRQVILQMIRDPRNVDPSLLRAYNQSYLYFINAANNTSRAEMTPEAPVMEPTEIAGRVVSILADLRTRQAALEQAAPIETTASDA